MADVLHAVHFGCCVLLLLLMPDMLFTLLAAGKTGRTSRHLTVLLSRVLGSVLQLVLQAASGLAPLFPGVFALEDDWMLVPLAKFMGCIGEVCAACHIPPVSHQFLWTLHLLECLWNLERVCGSLGVPTIDTLAPRVAPWLTVAVHLPVWLYAGIVVGYVFTTAVRPRLPGPDHLCLLLMAAGVLRMWLAPWDGLAALDARTRGMLTSNVTNVTVQEAHGLGAHNLSYQVNASPLGAYRW